MANIEIRTESAKSELDAIEKRIDALNGRTIKIKVDAKGIDKISKDLIKYTEAMAKNTNAQARQIKAENELAVQKEKTKQAIEKAAQAEKKFEMQTGQATEHTDKLSKSTYNLANHVMGYVVTNAIGKVVAAFKNAVAEMKAVDTEMISLQMSTGKTAGELKALRDSAYETASALGTTASEYLKTVSDFGDAGYTEQADELGKLAVMAARVGNTTQETANQYLIAVDRAYQYEGNVRKLTASLDGANAISNEYATNMDKIAAGFAEVGPVSAQAQVGIDEVTAALGTITAVTQGTGEEAGEALKSAFLGIMGDTQTEISDGVRWTAGELAA